MAIGCYLAAGVAARLHAVPLAKLPSSAGTGGAGVKVVGLVDRAEARHPGWPLSAATGRCGSGMRPADGRAPPLLATPVR
jgi:hypothetical protein